MGEHIPKNELCHGKYYKGECRNATIARWDGVNGVFWYWRNKFNHQFVESIHCPEDDSNSDVFFAHSEVDPEQEIPI